MGVFEFEACSKGTFTVANALKDATKKGAYTLVGGGDSVAAINVCGLADDVSYVSTGGGAMLEYLEGENASWNRSNSRPVLDYFSIISFITNMLFT